MKNDSKKVVIDACIARSSGYTKKPISENSRIFLEMIRNSDHKVVFNKDLSAEWNKHQSTFARKWRATMVAKRRVVFLDSCENIVLRDSIQEAITPENHVLAAMKDIHLIEVALQADKLIISGDNTVRLIFWSSIEKISLLQEIVWLNPVEQFEFVVKWFKEGAKITKEIFLSNIGRNIFAEAATAKEIKSKKHNPH